MRVFAVLFCVASCGLEESGLEVELSQRGLDTCQFVDAQTNEIQLWTQPYRQGSCYKLYCGAGTWENPQFRNNLAAESPSLNDAIRSIDTSSNISADFFKHAYQQSYTQGNYFELWPNTIVDDVGSSFGISSLKCWVYPP